MKGFIALIVFLTYGYLIMHDVTVMRKLDKIEQQIKQCSTAEVKQ